MKDRTDEIDALWDLLLLVAGRNALLQRLLADRAIDLDGVSLPANWPPPSTPFHSRAQRMFEEGFNDALFEIRALIQDRDHS